MGRAKTNDKKTSDKSSSLQEAQMSWSDSVHVDIKTDRTDGTRASNVPLLRDVPSHRRVSVLWKDINAYVPIFNANPTWAQKLRLAPKQEAKSKVQVRLSNIPC